ncbi:MAG TPA: hypothetical protein VE175_04055, partial [Woeseiaceae bacterium]|nr:hypothetical protein [Woeseiaceae bacterium]
GFSAVIAAQNLYITTVLRRTGRFRDECLSVGHSPALAALRDASTDAMDDDSACGSDQIF